MDYAIDPNGYDARYVSALRVGIHDRFFTSLCGRCVKQIEQKHKSNHEASVQFYQNMLTSYQHEMESRRKRAPIRREKYQMYASLYAILFAVALFADFASGGGIVLLHIVVAAIAIAFGYSLLSALGYIEESEPTAPRRPPAPSGSSENEFARVLKNRHARVLEKAIPAKYESAKVCVHDVFLGNEDSELLKAFYIVSREAHDRDAYNGYALFRAFKLVGYEGEKKVGSYRNDLREEAERLSQVTGEPHNVGRFVVEGIDDSWATGSIRYYH